MKQWHELKKLIAVVFAIALVAAACGDSDDETTSTTTGDDNGGPSATAPDQENTEVAEVEGERAYGGRVTLALEAEAGGLRPWEDVCATPCYNMMITIYDKLIEQTAGGAYEPWLAESFSGNDDFTVWTVTLRQGVEFHNGVPLTAQTIADMFPIQQTGATGASQIGSANLAAVEATGEYEVTYTLGQPNSAFPAYLSRVPLGMVFEPAAAADDPEGFSLAPIGTGPFVIESRDPDNETIVVRNDRYWGTDPEGNPLPYLDSISFRPIPDEGTRLTALQSSSDPVNAMLTLRQNTIRDARNNSEGLTLYEHQGNNAGGGMYNVMKAPTDDVRVRRGLTLMNSQTHVIEALGGTGISLPATQWFSPDSPWYSEAAAAAWPTFDFEAGEALIQEYVNDPERSDGKAVGEPIDIELGCPPDPTLSAAMQVLQAAWTETGLVNVSTISLDQSAHQAYAVGAPEFVGEHQALCWRWSDESDPSVTLNMTLAPPTAEVAEMAGVPGVVSPLNVSNWFHPDAFGAAIQAIRTDDFEQRKALYESINLLIAEHVPHWYSGHTATMIAVESNIMGLNGWHLPSGELGIGLPNAEGRWAEVWIAD